MLFCSPSRRRCLLVLVVCSFLFPVAPSTAFGQQDEAQQRYMAAQQAQRLGHLDEAAREYERVVQLLPDAAEAYASLGLVYNAQQKYRESIQALSRAEKLKPGLPGVSLYLGIDLLRLHEAAQAVPHLQLAVRVEPRNEQSYTWLSEAYSDTGQLEAAIDALRKAELLAPSDPVPLLDLSRSYRRAAARQILSVLKASPPNSPLRHQVFGDIYKDEHSWQNARAHYFKAIEEDPQWHGAHQALADIALKNQDFVLAGQEYRRELEVDPRSAAAMAALGEIALLEGRAEDGLGRLRQAVQIAPWRAAHALGLPHSAITDRTELTPEAQTQLAECLPVLTQSPAGAGRDLAIAFVDLHLADHDGFDQAWRRYQQSAPPAVPGSSYERAMLNFDRLELDTASTQLRTILSSHPSDQQARYLLARTEQALSLESLEKLLASHPDSYPAHQALAELYREDQEDDKALQEYAAVEKMAPDLRGLHLAVGSLLFQMHRDDDALNELHAELALDPLSAEANHEAGEVYLHRQDVGKAIPCLERAVQQDPGLWSARQQLGQAYYSAKQYAKAAEALQAVLSHDSDGSAHFQLGLAFRALGETQKAREQFEVSRTLKLQSLAHAETELATFQKQSQ